VRGASARRRARTTHTRAASSPRAASGPRTGAGSPGLGEDRLPRRADVDDLAGLQLERLDLLTRQLRRQHLAVVAHELDAHLETEMDEPLHNRLRRPSVPLAPSIAVVRGGQGVPAL